MILILMGVSGSGKTRIGQQLAAELDWLFFDGDDFHPPENIAKMSLGLPLTDADRDPWLASLQDLMRQLLRDQQSAIIACSALKQTYRDRLQVDPAVRFVYLKGAYDLIQQRLQKRTDHYMPPALLQSQLATLEEPKNTLTIDVSQSPDIIVHTLKQHVKA